MKKWKSVLFTGMAVFALGACGNGGGGVPGEASNDESMPVSSSQETSAPESVGQKNSFESMSSDSMADSSSSSSGSSEMGQMNPESPAVTLNDAIDIFLSEFPDAQIEEIEFEKDHGRWIYEINGAWNDREHELEIDAENGDIVDRDEDSLDDNNRYLDLDKLIEGEEAVKNAKQEIGQDAILESWELEIETHNGEEIPIFEVEFSNDSREVDIHGETGEVLGIDD